MVGSVRYGKRWVYHLGLDTPRRARITGRGHRTMNPVAAHTLGIRALAFLAGNPAALGRFLAATGIGPQDLRDQADDPALLGGVLDLLLGDEPLLLAFCEAEQVAPETPGRARRPASRFRPTHVAAVDGRAAAVSADRHDLPPGPAPTN